MHHVRSILRAHNAGAKVVHERAFEAEAIAAEQSCNLFEHDISHDCISLTNKFLVTHDVRETPVQRSRTSQEDVLPRYCSFCSASFREPVFFGGNYGPATPVLPF